VIKVGTARDEHAAASIEAVRQSQSVPKAFAQTNRVFFVFCFVLFCFVFFGHLTAQITCTVSVRNSIQQTSIDHRKRTT
jgi:hypothetical protein